MINKKVPLVFRNTTRESGFSGLLGMDYFPKSGMIRTMKITILLENSDGNNGCAFEHGLSVYIETARHRILADTGASGKSIENAALLGIDLTKVDLVFLSHGHYDHSGGILDFYKLNKTAPVYMQKTAVLEYYSGEKFIGIAPEIKDLPTVHFLEGNYKVDDEVEFFSGVVERRYWPSGNFTMARKEGDSMVPDTFDHEQSLVIHGEKEVLVCGCAHCGILNILDKYRSLFGRDPELVIGGFHMMKKTDYTEEEKELVIRTAEELAQMDTVFYTGHCTGGKALSLMSPILSEKLIPLYSGMEVL